MEKVHDSERITVYRVVDDTEAKAKVESDKKAAFRPVDVIPWVGEDGQKYLTYVW